MSRRLVLAFCFGQAAALLASGLLTIGYSESLMVWLIHLVGEERALGASSVIRQPGGGVLLTNPGALARWMLPFLFLGTLQITSALTLAWLGSRRAEVRTP